MTIRTKKIISGYNSYNYTIKSDINQKKYFMKIIVTLVYFVVIYSQSIILCEETEVKKDSESQKKYYNVTVEADSIRTKVFVSVFVKSSTSKKRSWFSCWRNSSEESIYELLDFTGLIADYSLVALYHNEQTLINSVYKVLDDAQRFLKLNYYIVHAPIVFALTAGLRLFNKESETIVNQVTNILSQYRNVYQINENAVLIMNENNEGFYAWLTVNLMNKTIKDLDKTIAVLDLRDSSLQIIFYLPPKNLQNYESQFVKKYTIMGIERHFYNQSHLDFGLMEMRIKILTSNNNKSIYSSPCHGITDNFLYTYIFNNYEITGSSPKDDIYKLCLSAVQSLIAENVNKVTIKQPIMAISFFHETALEAKLISNTEECITIEKFKNAAIQCFSQTFEVSKPFRCFDLVYIYALLNHLINVGGNPSITVKNYNIISDISWALGADYLKLPIIENK
ncbi:ectonucleoside triphosphate diphosphohydrolase 5-like [Melanaphis sacchari]|uniref:ectonucleoside triphosphate diphosphohydrolase 5-like n=1 Tax=Melanaphis sacchari TaxID=742174 RepID=UPI000DC12E44|nr:ectonucleoside triphosphate diphosphohydrolase 5-like [Melanaphis sacchari]XP_025197745.1 ectonucleoside triphosphate diphosphohydrolase 5-like [Melanaphis sacchari]XP_025197746.1 ectonucleoside triphosphate diphosphohydrolase 5-like [Melanaphis sacchari]